MTQLQLTTLQPRALQPSDRVVTISASNDTGVSTAAMLGAAVERQFATLATLTAASTAGLAVGASATVVADSTVGNNGLYAWSGSAWVRISDTPVSSAAASAAAAQAAATTAVDAAEAAQDAVTVIPAWSATQVQMSNLPLVSPVPVLVGSSGANLTLQPNRTNVMLVGALTAQRLLPDTTAVVQASSTIAGSNAGVAVGFAPAGPTPGGPLAVLNSAFVALQFRQNGAVQIVDRDGGTGTAPTTGITLTPTPSLYPWTINQLAEIAVAVSPTGSVRVTLTVDGTAVYSGTLAGVASGSFLWAGVRTSGGTTDVHTLRPVFHVTAGPRDPVKTVYISGTGTGGGWDPSIPANWADALRAVEADARRNSLRLVLRGNTIYRGALTFSGTRWRSVEIIGDGPTPAEIRPSVEIAAGSGAFTNVTGDVWSINSRGMLAAGSLHETTAGVTSPLGRSGMWSMEGALYNRVAPQTLPAALAVGDYSAWASSTYAGLILIRMPAGVDPNAKRWELVNRQAGITWVRAGDFSSGLLKMENITVNGGYAAAIDARGVSLDWADVRAYRATAGAALQLDACRGQLRACQFGWSAGDGLNMAGGVAGASADPALMPTLQLDGCVGVGHPVLAGWNADNISNHDRAGRLLIREFEGRGARKDGISAGGPVSISNSRFIDAADSGFKLYGTANTTVQAILAGVTARACFRGIAADAVATSAPGIIATRCHVADPIDAAYSCVVAGATQRLEVCTWSGTTPTRGVRDDRAGGSAFTVVTGAAA